MNVVVSGATGYLGVPIVRALRERGDTVTVLTRAPQRAHDRLGDVTAVAAQLETPGAWREALAGADAMIHLAGESIGALDARQKQIVRDSRVEATRTLVEAFGARTARPPRVPSRRPA